MKNDMTKPNGYSSGYELITHIDNRDWTLILRRESPGTSIVTQNLHKHLYSEIIMMESGAVDFQVGDKRFTVNTNDFLIIPSMTFHKGIPLEDNNVHMISIQIDHNFPEPFVHATNPGIFSELLRELEQTYRTGCCGRSSAYFAQILSPFLCANRQKLAPLQDRRYIIDEYLSYHYAEDITLKDIAMELNLSEKQAARQVLKYTGNPFRLEIPRKRIEAAQYLLATENLSLEEVAEQVGYHSYSSFWKALRKSSPNN